MVGFGDEEEAEENGGEHETDHEGFYRHDEAKEELLVPDKILNKIAIFSTFCERLCHEKAGFHKESRKKIEE